jgi:hypothetical protein
MNGASAALAVSEIRSPQMAAARIGKLSSSW